MSSKLKLTPNPTFRVLVSVPVPGGAAEDVEIEFKARSRTEIVKFVQSMEGEYENDTELLMDCMVGWNIDAEFSAENVELLVENYPGVAGRIVTAYLDELAKARLGN